MAILMGGNVEKKEARKAPSILTPIERVGLREALTKHLDAEALEVIAGDLGLDSALISEEKSLTWQWSRVLSATER